MTFAVHWTSRPGASPVVVWRLTARDEAHAERMVDAAIRLGVKNGRFEVIEEKK